MKHLILYQIKFLGILGLVVLFQACTKVPRSFKNDQISQSKRADFHELNTEALKYLKANDAKGLKALLSADLLEDAHIERKVELFSNRLNDNNYTLLDEYYVINKYIDQDTIPYTGGDINRYSLQYPGTAKEMYFAFFVPQKSDNKYLISLVYSKMNYGWKITKLDLGPYTINGKTAPELYAMAQYEYNKKYTAAALNTSALATTCFKPCDYWVYPDEADAKTFNNKLLAEANLIYNFPIVLRQLPTGPMILNVFNQKNDEGTYPMVYYMTHFNISDTVEVKKENEQIRKIIGKVIPGIDKCSKYLLYSAFNQQPNGERSVNRFEMTQKLQ